MSTEQSFRDYKTQEEVKGNPRDRNPHGVGLTRLMESVVFGVNPTDPATYFAASAGLVAIALLATYVPARRAAEVDPVEALRVD